MDKEICYKNHDNIVKLYKHLISNEGKKDFYEKIKMIKDNKEATKIVINMYWDEAKILLNIIKTISMKIVSNKLSNKSIQNYSLNLYKTLNKIKTQEQLYIFIYKLLDDKSLYDRVVKFYEILSNKSKCILLFK